MKTICVVGSGYVGTTTSALLALAGHKVTAIDISEEKVAAINNGKAPFFEQGLSEMIKAAVDDGSLKATTSTKPLEKADIIFSCVGTPDNADGSPNLRYIDDVADSVATSAKKGAIFVQKSTVPVGTGDRLRKTIKQQVYISNPEFLREGTAINDSLHYDRLVIGCEDDSAAKQVRQLYDDVLQAASRINAIAGIGLSEEQLNHTPEVINTTVKSAELIKVTANAFLALKISFANSVAKLADKSGADVTEVMHGVGTDRRIGTAFFNAGRGYGGGCFPKDVSGLISVAIDHGVDFSIMTAADDLNQSMPGYIVNKLQQTTSLNGKTVAVLGLAFKSGTSDARKSPAVQIANLLIRHGATVKAFDPVAIEEASEDLHEDVTISKTTEDCLASADVAIVATDWPEFKALSPNQFMAAMSGKIVVDSMNCLDRNAFVEGGLTYIGVGR